LHTADSYRRKRSEQNFLAKPIHPVTGPASSLAQPGAATLYAE